MTKEVRTAVCILFEIPGKAGLFRDTKLINLVLTMPAHGLVELTAELWDW